MSQDETVTETENIETSTEPENAETVSDGDEFEEYPDDHPLVKAYNAEKEKNKRIKSWLAQGDDADPAKSPEVDVDIKVVRVNSVREAMKALGMSGKADG